MCGIAGIILAQADRELARRAAGMTQTLIHRGPDDGGVAVFDRRGAIETATLGDADDELPTLAMPAEAALGARRLAILDLSPRGHQPMASNDGRAWIVHNGEIYNHAELRAELGARGIIFGSATDTEVALYAWLTWGPDCFRRFDGMWAMAIYEPRLRRLTLSRDRFGIKPLYYTRWRGGLAFASEIKAILSLPDVERRVNAPRLVDFLCEGWIDHTDETMLEEIRALPSGCRLTVQLQESNDFEMRLDRDLGWDHSDVSVGLRSQASGHNPPSSSLRSHLDRAIRLHLRSDVPVGSCLSGGIDSSTIVTLLCMMQSSTGALPKTWSQHTFTAVLPGDPLDESRYADAVIAACPGLHDHRVAPAANGLLDQLPALLRAQEEPFGSPSIYMQWEVMRLAKSVGVRVLLDGQGGDELFCGYPGYFPALVAEHVKALRMSDAWRLMLNPRVQTFYAPSAMMRHTIAQLLPEKTREDIRRQSRRWRQGFITNDLLSTAPDEEYARNEDRDASSPFRCFWRRVLEHTSLPGLLHYEDRNSMAHSIEARVPLLSRDVAHFAMGLSPQAQLRDGWTKAVLRDAVRGIIPDTIVNRTDKIGFAAPTLRWMQGGLRTWWRDALSHAAVSRRGWARPAAVERLSSRIESGNPGAALIMWRLAIAHEWASMLRIQ